MKRLFLTSSVNFVAHDIAKQIKGKKQKLLFITTAVEVVKGDLQWFRNDRKSLVRAGFIVTDYTITNKKKKEIDQAVENTDIIYMSGGNSFYLLQQIQQTHSAQIFRDHVNKGKIYIGTSAGSIIAAPDIYPTYYLDKAKQAPKLKGYKGLSLVDFLVFPHWGSWHFKKLYLNHRLNQAYQEKYKLILLNNYQYVLVEDDWYKIVEVKHK